MRAEAIIEEETVAKKPVVPDSVGETDIPAWKLIVGIIVFIIWFSYFMFFARVP